MTVGKNSRERLHGVFEQRCTDRHTILGYNARVPLLGGKTDLTEVDMSRFFVSHDSNRSNTTLVYPAHAQHNCRNGKSDSDGTNGKSHAQGVLNRRAEYVISGSQMLRRYGKQSQDCFRC